MTGCLEANSYDSLHLPLFQVHAKFMVRLKLLYSMPEACDEVLQALSCVDSAKHRLGHRPDIR